MSPLLFEDAAVALHPIAPDLDPTPLDPGERALVDAARSPHRAQELLGGRLAARAAFLAAGVSRPPAVLREPDGRPRLEPPGTGWFVSIAHDGELAAAAVSHVPVGLDLLLVSRFERAQAVVDQRVETKRAVPLPPHPELPWPDAALCWTAWEALGKHDGGGVFPAMERAIALHPRADGLHGEAGGVRLRWWQSNEALLCLATGYGDSPGPLEKETP